jgi:hypothetical protein
LSRRANRQRRAVFTKMNFGNFYGQNDAAKQVGNKKPSNLEKDRLQTHLPIIC